MPCCSSRRTCTSTSPPSSRCSETCEGSLPTCVGRRCSCVGSLPTCVGRRCSCVGSLPTCVGRRCSCVTSRCQLRQVAAGVARPLAPRVELEVALEVRSRLRHAAQLGQQQPEVV